MISNNELYDINLVLIINYYQKIKNIIKGTDYGIN